MGLSVLLCTDYKEGEGGGVEVVVNRLKNDLSNFGVNARLLTLSPDNEEGDADYVFPAIDLTQKLGVQGRISVSLLRDLRSTVKEMNPDVIHINNRFFFTSFAVATLKRLKLIDVPIVTTFHLGTIQNLSGAAGRLGDFYERSVAKQVVAASNAFIGVSEASAAAAKGLGANSFRISVIPNGVDTEQFYPAKDRASTERILFVGRLVGNKGPETLIKAMPVVLEKRPQAELVLISTGPMQGKLEQLVERFKITNSVTFVDHVDSVAKEMRNADIFCRPSLTEGMPLTLLEAMATGLPAVVTPVGGVEEVVKDGKTGFLVNPKNSITLAERLTYLLESPVVREDVGRAAREYVENNHSWEERAEKVFQVYRKAIEDVSI